MGVILRCKQETHNYVKLVLCQSVPNFLSCVCAKYYLNWFTVGKVTTKIKRVNFLFSHSA